MIVPHEEWNLIANGVDKVSRMPLYEGQGILTAQGYSIDSLKGFLWDFEESASISSYIYGLCAGNYHKIEYIG